MKERCIISIDLKSFFASVECVKRGYDPFKVPLVVCDTSRGEAGMCLAVSPYLRNLGVKSRCRLFELPKNIKIIKAKPITQVALNTSSISGDGFLCIS